MTTKPITRFNRATCSTVGTEALAALQAVADKYGLTVARKSGNYSDASFNVTLTFSAKTGSGVPADFARSAPLIGLKPEDYGKTFTTYGGKTYRVTGINLRRAKYPVSAEDVNTGKGFKFPAAQVIADLKRAA